MTGRSARGFLLPGAGIGAAAVLAGAAEALTPVIVLDRGRPVRLLAAVHDSRDEVLIALGELAFKSGFLLEGSPLRTLGAQMTCDSRHPDGGASPVVFFEGLSDKPGNLDVTNRAVSLIEDNVHNPVDVPGIVGARHSAPFGRDGRFESVEDFTLFAGSASFAASRRGPGGRISTARAPRSPGIAPPSPRARERAGPETRYSCRLRNR